MEVSKEFSRELDIAIDQKIISFLKAKRTDYEQLQKELKIMLLRAKGREEVHCLFDVEVKLLPPDKLETKITPRTWSFKYTHYLDDSFDNVYPDESDWDESVCTYPPVSAELVKEIAQEILDEWHDIYMGTCSFEEAVDQSLNKLNESGKLPFKVKRGTNYLFVPENPWKEKDGFVIVKKQ